MERARAAFGAVLVHAPCFGSTESSYSETAIGTSSPASFLARVDEKKYEVLSESRPG